LFGSFGSGVVALVFVVFAFGSVVCVVVDVFCGIVSGFFFPPHAALPSIAPAKTTVRKMILEWSRLIAVERRRPPKGIQGRSASR
jgi:hypothetical protein